MKIEKEAEKLVLNIYKVLYLLDNEMRKPSDQYHGKRIAQLSNFLEFEADSFSRFVLKYGFKKISNLKKKAEKND